MATRADIIGVMDKDDFILAALGTLHEAILRQCPEGAERERWLRWMELIRTLQIEPPAAPSDRPQSTLN